MKVSVWRRRTRLLLNWIALRDWYWATAVTASRVSPDDARVVGPGRGLYLRRLDITVPKGSALFMISGYPLALELTTRAQAQFRCDFDGGILVEVSGVRAKVSTEEELFILHEIFVEGVYNVLHRGPLVVWDVGMNIGLASLYFARMAEFEVVGYEPVAETYQLALENIARNPHLAGRIRTVNMGIGAADSVSTLYSSSEKRGATGIFPIPESLAPADSTVMKEVRIQSASGALAWIRENYPARSIIAKIDCEGSEYQIIRELCESKCIGQLDGIMLEWHRRQEDQSPVELADRLRGAGFTVFLQGSMNAASGMLYAVRRAA